MPIVTYHTTLIADNKDPPDVSAPVNATAGNHTKAHSSKTAKLVFPSHLATSHSLLLPDTAEPAPLQTNVKTTSNILLSRGVKNDPSAPTSSCTSPTIKGSEARPLDIEVTTIFEGTGSRIMTFGSARPLMRRNSEGQQEWDDPEPRREGGRSEGVLGSRGAADVPGLVPKRTEDNDHIQVDCTNGLSDTVLLPDSDYERRRQLSYEEGFTPRQPVRPATWSNPGSSLGDLDNEWEPSRGRELHRHDRIPDPFSRASSRTRNGDTAIEINVRMMQHRSVGLRRSSTFFDDPSDQDAELEDDMLEPLPDPICAGMDEILENEDSKARQYQKRFTEATIHLALTITDHSRTWPILKSSEYGVDPDRSRDPLKIPRGTSYTNSSALAASKPQGIDRSASSSVVGHDEQPAKVATKGKEKENTAAVASIIPAEILNQIYLHLSPADFNAARHTCRSWYINSLSHTLLHTMLKRGGWSSAVEKALLANQYITKSLRLNEEWLMSKCLARECSLGPDWTGNGMSLTPAEVAAGRTSAVRFSPFRLSSKVDFRGAGTNHATHNGESCGMLFTASSCSKFLMVSHGSIVYVYELNRSHKKNRGDDRVQSGALRPFTCIICPRRVLACSMDTSSNRDAIAILMEGRMGLVCAVTGNSNRSGKAIYLRDLRKMQEDANVFPVSRGGSWRNDHSLGTSHSVRSYPPYNNQQLQVSLVAPDTANLNTPISADSDPEQFDYLPFDTPGSKPRYPRLFEQTYQMPIEASPPTLYALLCSADDPPRSVAICPQRRCVAFGCSSGIELHWVDALTGEDLNRWFPLVAPSDYLYFLPPRAGVDSAKKLRLVSSQGPPAERSTISERFVGKKKNSAFWGIPDHGWQSSGDSGEKNSSYEQPKTLRRVVGGSDHYRAVPLCDGHHLLFTDPYSGLLCLGNDAPLGGPTKLVRKLCFIGPIGEGSPICYAAGSDLRHGVMVVAAYGIGREAAIMYYNVPADVFADCSARGDVTIAPGFTATSAGRGNRHNAEWTQWWGLGGNGLYDWPHLSSAGMMNMSWPIQIRGQEVGRCLNVADMAVHSGPEIGITVWAFCRQGKAYTWSMSNGCDDTVKQRWVVRDGTVRESGGDVDADAEMLDVEDVYPNHDLRAERADNAADAASQEFDGAYRSSRRVSVVDEPVLDRDGDVSMTDVGLASLGLGQTDIELEEGKKRILDKMGRKSPFTAADWSDMEDKIVLESYRRPRTADREGEFYGFETVQWSMETHGRPEDDEIQPNIDMRDWRVRRGRSRRTNDPGMSVSEEFFGAQRIDFEIA